MASYCSGLVQSGNTEAEFCATLPCQNSIELNSLQPSLASL